MYAAFTLSIIGLLWPYAFYPTSILVLSKIFKKEHKYDEDYVQKVSIIIPCHNEEKVIKSKLDNTLQLDYPKNLMQIVVIDDGSTDGTKDIIKEYQNEGISLLTFNERKGKAAAMNYALSQVQNSVIITTDADTFVEKTAIKHLVKHFSDPKIGIVGGNSLVRIPFPEPEVNGRDILTKYEGFLERKESNVDSTANLGGQLMAIRTNLAKFDESSIAEDFDCLMNARANGYRVISETKACAWEYVPSSEHEIFNHQRRMSTGSIQTLFKFRRVLFNPKYGLFGLVILPGHRLSQILNPFFLFLAVFFSTLTCFLVFNPIFIGLVIFELVWIIIAIVSYILKIKTIPINYLNYFSIIQYSMILSWIAFFKGKHTVKWEKIESNRSNGIPSITTSENSHVVIQ